MSQTGQVSVRDNNFPEKTKVCIKRNLRKEKTLRVRCWQGNPEALDGSSVLYVPGPEDGCGFRMQNLAQKKHALGTTGGGGGQKARAVQQHRVEKAQCGDLKHRFEKHEGSTRGAQQIPEKKNNVMDPPAWKVCSEGLISTKTHRKRSNSRIPECLSSKCQRIVLNIGHRGL